MAAGCGDDDAGTSTATREAATAEGRGLVAELPDGWRQAARSLTPDLTDPLEVLSVATFPLERGRAEACAHMPVGALEAIGPRDAFVTLMERGTGAAGFPSRPEHFGPELGGPSEVGECTERDAYTDHWFGFADAGRSFHVLVAFGPDAPPARRAEAWRVLDSLEVDPGVRPTWVSAG
jgi:hypothetical protein